MSIYRYCPFSWHSVAIAAGHLCAAGWSPAPCRGPAVLLRHRCPAHLTRSFRPASPRRPHGLRQHAHRQGNPQKQRAKTPFLDSLILNKGQIVCSASFKINITHTVNVYVHLESGPKLWSEFSLFGPANISRIREFRRGGGYKKSCVCTFFLSRPAPESTKFGSDKRFGLFRKPRIILAQALAVLPKKSGISRLEKVFLLRGEKRAVYRSISVATLAPYGKIFFNFAQ